MRGFSDVLFSFMVVSFNFRTILIKKISKYSHFSRVFVIFDMTCYSKCKISILEISSHQISHFRRTKFHVSFLILRILRFKIFSPFYGLRNFEKILVYSLLLSLHITVKDDILVRLSHTPLPS